MTSLMQTLTNDMSDSTAAAGALESKSGGFTAKEAKAVINSAADKMHEFAKDFQLENAELGKQFRDAFNGIDQALAIQKTEGFSDSADMKKLDEGLGSLDPALRSGSDSIATFRQSVNQVPGLTLRLKRAKRDVSATLDDFIATLAVLLDRSSELRHHIAERLEELG
jgi:ABC-type transporter Mla subunit MlaD